MGSWGLEVLRSWGLRFGTALGRLPRQAYRGRLIFWMIVCVQAMAAGTPARTQSTVAAEATSWCGRMMNLI